MFIHFCLNLMRIWHFQTFELNIAVKSKQYSKTLESGAYEKNEGRKSQDTAPLMVCNYKFLFI